VQKKDCIFAVNEDSFCELLQTKHNFFKVQIMLKKFLFAAAFAVIAVVGAMIVSAQNEKPQASLLLRQNIEALAGSEINPDCQNGCMEPSGHCWCNGYHPYTEA
jgi:hypothetical protein